MSFAFIAQASRPAKGECWSAKDNGRDKGKGDFRYFTSRHRLRQGSKVREGKNGGGDPWHTDGRLYVGVAKKIIE